MVLSPGGVTVVERAIDDDDETAANLITCEIRGWIAVLHPHMPHGRLASEATTLPPFTGTKHVYRLTEAGWSQLNRTQAWVISTFVVALLTLGATMFGVYLTAYPAK